MGKDSRKVTARKLKVDASKAPENYLSYNINNFTIGQNHGSTSPSVAFNDYILNSGGHINLGTGTNLRIGKHIFFTYLRLRLFYTAPSSGNRTRIIVGKQAGNATFANIATNGALAAAVEGEVIETTQVGTGPVVSDEFISPSTEYQILYDKMLMWDTPFSNNIVSPASAATVPGALQASVDLVIPIMMQRMYNVGNSVDRGDWFVWFGSNTSTQVNLQGQIRIEFINQFDWESIPRAIKGTFNAADDVFQRAKDSPALLALLAALAAL